MSAGFFYYGEASGARILRGNVGLTQVTAGSTEPVLMAVKTWDKQPGGPLGDVVFRDAAANFKTTNGANFDITSSVDDVDQDTQRFSAAGAISFSAEATVAERGNRIAIKVQEVSRTGDVELEDCIASFLVIRTTP